MVWSAQVRNGSQPAALEEDGNRCDGRYGSSESGSAASEGLGRVVRTDRIAAEVVLRERQHWAGEARADILRDGWLGLVRTGSNGIDWEGGVGSGGKEPNGRIGLVLVGGSWDVKAWDEEHVAPRQQRLGKLRSANRRWVWWVRWARQQGLGVVGDG